MNPSRKYLVSIAALFSVLGAVAMSGCGKTVVDSQKAEDAITQNIEDQTNVQVESVSCPDNVEVVADVVFECDITLADGKTAVAELKILNDNADVRIVKLSRT